jgi:hypothetical protein
LTSPGFAEGESRQFIAATRLAVTCALGSAHAEKRVALVDDRMYGKRPRGPSASRGRATKATKDTATGFHAAKTLAP